MTNSTNIPSTARLLAILEAEVATTELDTSEFDLIGAVEALLENERNLGRKLDTDTDGLLIAGTLEDYWHGE